MTHGFQRFAGFDDDAVFGGLPDGGHDGGGGCQDQGAGAEYHQNRNGGDEIALDEAGDNGNQEGNRHQPAGATVCNALHGCLFLFRFLDHTD